VRCFGALFLLSRLLMVSDVRAADHDAPAAHAIPDSAARRELESVLAGRSKIRVAGPFGRAELFGHRVDAEGLAFERAVSTSAADSAIATPIAWSRIERIEIEGISGKPILAGAIIGSVGGTALGVMVGQGVASSGSGSATESIVGLTIAGAAVGALAGVIGGALVGAPWRSWQAVYKSPGSAPQR
jgi:hypothetical protein